MKVLTLTQPWATLVAKGHKRIETRSWNTNYRGPLAIHAAKGFPNAARAMCHSKPFIGTLGHYDFDPITLPVGKIIATCELVHVLRMDEIHVFPACKSVAYQKRIWSLDEQERAFGLYEVGRYMWLLDNIKPLHPPVEANGKLGLWEYALPEPTPEPGG